MYLCGRWVQVTIAGKGEGCTNIQELEETRSIQSIVSARWRPRPEEFVKRACCVMMFIFSQSSLYRAVKKRKQIRDREGVGKVDVSVKFEI